MEFCDVVYENSNPEEANPSYSEEAKFSKIKLENAEEEHMDTDGEYYAHTIIESSEFCAVVYEDSNPDVTKPTFKEEANFPEFKFEHEEEEHMEPDSEYYADTVIESSDDEDLKNLKKYLPYVCQLCGDRFSKKLGIQLHNASKLHCNECGYVFCTYLQLTQHNCKKIEFRCKLCSKTFLTERNLKEHTEKGVCSKNLQCPHCLKVFKSSVLTKKHQIVHSTEKPFVCSICSKSFAMNNRLKAHEKTHYPKTKTLSVIGVKEFLCDICSKNFTTKGVLRRHQIVIHKIGEKKTMHPCFECNKKFLLPILLKRHMVTVHGEEKPFPCELCDRGFVENHHLRKHIMECHTDERPFMCDKCSGRFSRLSTLKKHKCYIQKLSRPFSCKCGKRFVRKSSLNRHKCGVDLEEDLDDPVYQKPAKVIPKMKNGQ